MSKNQAEQTAGEHRQIQQANAKTEGTASDQSGKQELSMQAGARQYPTPPFPKQHQPKPGEEA